MAEAAVIAGVASVASAGLGATGTVMGGQASKSSAEFRAAQAERAAEIGRTQAELTDTVMRENLNTLIGNIGVIRSAGRIDPGSPTTAAVEDYNRRLSDRQRLAAVGTQLAQSAEDTAAASYLRQAGQFALNQSYIGAGVQLAGGVAQTFGPRGSYPLGRTGTTG